MPVSISAFLVWVYLKFESSNKNRDLFENNVLIFYLKIHSGLSKQKIYFNTS